jgi:hypothetical protein
VPALPGGSATGEIGINPQAKDGFGKLRSLTFTVTGSLASAGLAGEGHAYTVNTEKLAELNLSDLGREISVDKIKDFITAGRYDDLGAYFVDLVKGNLME